MIDFHGRCGFHPGDGALSSGMDEGVCGKAREILRVLIPGGDGRNREELGILLEL